MKMKEYLKDRGVKDQDYLHFMKNNPEKLDEFSVCRVDGFDFRVSHFLDESDKLGYGLVVTNQQLKLDNTKYLAIGLIEGDDVICLNLENGTVALWLVENDDGNWLQVADSFADFVDMIF